MKKTPSQWLAACFGLALLMVGACGSDPGSADPEPTLGAELGADEEPTTESSPPEAEASFDAVDSSPPTGPAIEGAVDLIDGDGYSHRAEIVVAVDHTRVEIANAPPGQADLFVEVSGNITIVNTTPGRILSKYITEFGLHFTRADYASVGFDVVEQRSSTCWPSIADHPDLRNYCSLATFEADRPIDTPGVSGPPLDPGGSLTFSLRPSALQMSGIRLPEDLAYATADLLDADVPFGLHLSGSYAGTVLSGRSSMSCESVVVYADGGRLC